jgi:hypothetical protein
MSKDRNENQNYLLWFVLAVLIALIPWIVLA